MKNLVGEFVGCKVRCAGAECKHCRIYPGKAKRFFKDKRRAWVRSCARGEFKSPASRGQGGVGFL